MLTFKLCNSEIQSNIQVVTVLKILHLKFEIILKSKVVVLKRWLNCSQTVLIIYCVFSCLSQCRLSMTQKPTAKGTLTTRVLVLDSVLTVFVRLKRNTFNTHLKSADCLQLELQRKMTQSVKMVH